MKTEKKEEILKRFYRGETTVEEERLLKKHARDKGTFQETPLLAWTSEEISMPEEVLQNIQTAVHRKAVRTSRYRNLIITSLAASLLLFISIRSLLSPTPSIGVSLSDRLKKERFEDALRIIGQVLEEEKAPVQQILYEDNKLIIAVE